MDLSPAIASAISAMLAVPIFMALMRRIKSFRHLPNSRKSFAQLAREYEKWERLATLLAFVFIALIGLVIWAALDTVYSWQLSYQEPGIFLIGLPSILWIVPAFFFALFIVAIPLHYIFLGLLGRQRYAEYIEYGDQKFRINSWKLFRYLGNILLPLCLVLTLMALDTYARVTEEAFIVNRFIGIGEKSYRLDQLKEIVLVKSFSAPNGDIVREPYYVIGFDDGTEYDFRKTLTEMDILRQRELIGFLVDATRLETGISDPYPS